MYVCPIQCGTAELRRRVKDRLEWSGPGVSGYMVGPMLHLSITDRGNYPAFRRSGAASMTCLARKGTLYCFETPITIAEVFLAVVMALVAGFVFSRSTAHIIPIALLFFALVVGVCLVVSHLDTRKYDYISELLSEIKQLCEP